ncbi:hypothetical protein IAR55_001835 [Kwoniella newhampshirensis]|uniref:Transcription initiation factor TFIID subunit 13 n=1 Tax=Kwoniella newhampshirensis TaxID=1651941 RepID=A0AAW0Z3B1_9TREE
MSQSPNNGNLNQQSFYGQARPSNPPSSLVANGSPNPNAASPMMGVRSPLASYNSATAAGSSTPNRPQQFNPAQLAQLTDFHQRQQAVLAAQVQRAQAQGIRPNIQALQQAMQQRMQNQQSQQQQNAFQQGLQAPNTSMTPQRLHAMIQHLTPQQLQQLQAVRPPAAPTQPPVAVQSITPQQLQTTMQPSVTPQQLQQLAQPSQAPPTANPAHQRPISQNQPALNPALLTATKAYTSSSVPPLPSNTARPSVPVTEAFSPVPESVPRQPSPEKGPTKPEAAKQRSTSPAKIKQAGRRSTSPDKKVKEEKKEDATKTDADKRATDKPKKPRRPARPKGDGEKKPRTKKQKDKETGDATPTVFFSAPEPTSKDGQASGDIRERAEAAGQKEADKVPKVTEPRSTESAVRASPAPPVPSAAAAASYPTEPRRRKEELMRGTMRNEIARLMYGAGDVAEPDVDTVDYMEDMVVEFLADLCRPAPPIRSNPSAQRQPVPMSFDILRHRLSSSSAMSKYLERFDRMVYMSEALKSAKNIANPTPHELIASVGADFLELDDDGKPTHGGSGGQQRSSTKRSALVDGEGGLRKKGRPLKPPGEKRKPGPQKGWKLNRDPNTLPTRRAVLKDPNAPKRKYVRKVGGKKEV